MPELKKEKSRALESMNTPIVFQTLLNVTFAICVVLLIILFLPWRQTVTGTGQVIVFSPMNRPQTIQAQIPSKIRKWHVQEGDYVEAGDIIIELEELDTKYLDNEQILKLQAQRDAIANKVQAIKNLISTYQSQVVSMQSIRENVVPNAELKIKQSENKLLGLRQKVEGLKQNKITAELNFDRRKKLFDKGLASQREYELAELAIAKATAEYNEAKANLTINEQQIDISRFDLNKVGLENQFKVQDIQAKIAESYDKLAEANKNLFKFDNDLVNLKERIDQRTIKALVAGQVTGVKALGPAQTVKKNEIIATIIPSTEDIAAELFVSEFFAPLLSVGRDVRVQFSGYPAIQFAGWPNIAVGTFAGEIIAVDAANLKKGVFRVLVKPDFERIEAGKDEKWPSLANLRPGSKSWGWIILDEVPVWYELWRVINGFPPSIMENKDKVSGVPKVK
jgi:adhesin transport system membrane fusion protein